MYSIIFVKIQVLYKNHIYDDNIIQMILKENKYILKYFFEKYKTQLNVKLLSMNTNAIDLLLEDEYINKICIDRLCSVEAKNISKILSKLYYEGYYDFKVFHRNRTKLSKNRYAIDFITENPRYINYDGLAQNLNATELLIHLLTTSKKFTDAFYYFLNINPNMIDYLIKHPNYILNTKYTICKNPNCVKIFNFLKYDLKNIVSNPTFEILESNNIDLLQLLYNSNIEKIVEELDINLILFYNNIININQHYTGILGYRSYNHYNCKEIWYNISRYCKKLDFLEHFKDKLQWEYLSYNECAISLIEDRWLNVESKNEIITDNCLNWKNLCLNRSAIKLLENNKNKIDWDNLALNENAIELLEDYIKRTKKQSKQFWNNISRNRNIFFLL